MSENDNDGAPFESPYRLGADVWGPLVAELKADAPPKRKAARTSKPKGGAAPDFAQQGTRSAWEVALELAGRLGRPLGDGRHAVWCINDAAHTSPERSADAAQGSCVLLPPAKDSMFGLPKCSHAHCQGLTLRQWIAAVGYDVWAEAMLVARGWRRAREFLLHDGGISGWKRVPFLLRDHEDTVEGGPYQVLPDDTEYCDFTARIVADVEEHEVSTSRRWYDLEARVGDRARRFRVPAAEFGSLSWVPGQLGPDAVIAPGRDTSTKLRAAIQYLSKPVPRVDSYTVTGFRKIGDRWVYLHAGGGIGAEGEAGGITMALRNDVLKGFLLPKPPEGPALREAVRAAADLFAIARPEVTIPLFGAVWRAPLGPSPLTVYLTAPTSSGKSLLAALAQQHFGASMDESRLPAGVKHATAASVNELRVLVGDAVFTYDDFRLSGSTSEDLRFNERLDTVVRSQYGGTGAQRLSRDGTLNSHGAPPRSLLLITGETVPAGDSLRRRLVVVDVEPIARRLEPEKAAAARGTYAAAMAGYVRWLAPRLDEVRAAARAAASEFTLKLVGGEDPNNRTALLLAEVAVGIEQFLRYAVDARALTEAEAEAFWQSAWRTIFNVAQQQQTHQTAQDPVHRFCELIGEALASARCHLTLRNGGTPDDTTRWGWRPPSSRGGDGEGEGEAPPPDDHPAGAAPGPRPGRVLRAMGDHLGFVDPKSGRVWFRPHIALHIARRLASDVGAPLPLTAEDLPRRLFERGLLAKVEAKRRTYTVRIEERTVVDGKPGTAMAGGYLCLSAASLQIEGFEESLPVGRGAVSEGKAVVSEADSRIVQ